LALVLPAVAWAQSYEPARLDRPFAALQGAADEPAAAAAVVEIWRQWMVLADREQRLLMELGMLEMRRGELTDADATFTRLIEQAPDLPEPGHTRGTIRMLQGELAPAV